MKRALRLPAVVAFLVAVATPPAPAHEGRGAIEVLAAEPAGPLAVAYRVRLTFVADGHAVDGATVTLVGEDDAGHATAPTPMEPGGTAGVYVATAGFPAPGTWRLRFTAVTPPATAERTEVVAPPPTTTMATTTVPATTTSTVGDDAGGGPSTPLLALLAIPVVVGAVVLVRRRRKAAVD